MPQKKTFWWPRMSPRRPAVNSRATRVSRYEVTAHEAVVALTPMSFEMLGSAVDTGLSDIITRRLATATAKRAAFLSWLVLRPS